VRNHAHLCWDTLYGLDTGFRPQLQLAEGHVFETATGWRMPVGRAASTLAGMGSEIGWVLVSQPNSMSDQRLAPCPPTLMNNPG
jgi:hypothetical protein